MLSSPKSGWQLANYGMLSRLDTRANALKTFFNSDLGEGTECILSTFADDTGLAGAVDTQKVRETVETVLNILGEWTDM